MYFLPPRNSFIFSLLTACSMGIDSSMAVPRHVYVRLPNTSVSGSQSETCVQQQICRCGNKKLDNCRSILCTAQSKCHLGGAQGGISKSKWSGKPLGGTSVKMSDGGIKNQRGALSKRKWSGNPWGAGGAVKVSDQGTQVRVSKSKWSESRKVCAGRPKGGSECVSYIICKRGRR